MTDPLASRCPNCGKPGRGFSACEHCGEFIGMTLALDDEESDFCECDSAGADDEEIGFVCKACGKPIG